MSIHSERKATRRARIRAVSLTAILLATLALSMAPGGVAPPSPDPGEGDYTLTSRTVWSYYTETLPSLDDPTDSVWDYPLEVLGLVPGHVALAGGTSLEIRSVYTDEDIYFRIIWKDVVDNSNPPRWVFHDGNWTFTSPFEDGIGLYFPVTDPEDHFVDDGCMRTCHATDWENPRDQGRKFTLTDDETGDLWFWSAGITNPWGFALDAYVTSRPSDNNVGYYEDPEMDLNLLKNRHLTEYLEYVYLSRPVYMQDPNLEPRYVSAVIARVEEVVFDQNYYDPKSGDAVLNPITHEPWQNGDVVGGYVLDHLPEQGMGQIGARGSYDILEQQWSVVLRRALDTGDPVHDVIFDDLTDTYLFGLSLFGDIMGGGDASEPFVEPNTNDRCVMNKVTKTIDLRFRPVVEADRADPGAPDGWDGDGWASGTTNYLQELIHRSGEIHDAWGWVNVSAACDGERIYIHLRHDDTNESTEYGVDVTWLTPGMVSVEETFNLLAWSDISGHMSVEDGDADLWTWRWNGTTTDGVAVDMAITDAQVRADASGPDDLEARTWREDGSRHIVLSRLLDTGEDVDDVAFMDMARTYVLRLAVYTSERDEWFVSYPMSMSFEPDPADTVAPANLVGVTANDGGDSAIIVSWETSDADDFAQYRVYVSPEPFDDVMGMVPTARISDVSVDGLHLRGIHPGPNYHVCVVAVDDNRNLPSRTSVIEVDVTDDTPPPTPSVVKVFDNLDSDLLVSWEPGEAPDIERYEVYLEEEPFTDASGLEPIATVWGLRVSSYRACGLVAGTTYNAAVVAVDWADNADRHVTSVAGSPTDVTAPPEVRGLDASTPQEPDSEGEVLVKWRATSAKDVSYYNVYMSLTPIESVQNFAPIETVTDGETSVTVAGLNPKVKYYFSVTAVDRSGHEGPSKFSVSSRASTAEPPGAVLGLVAVHSGADSARLTWMAANVTGSPVVNYRVFMSREPISDLSGIAVRSIGNVTPTAEPTLLVTDLEQGTTYYFAVQAEDGMGHISPGVPQVASVNIPVVEEEGPSLWEVIGPPLTTVFIIVILGLLAYVYVSRQRKYGRLLSKRPAWAKRENGNGGK